jgi:tRNA-splicing ligase RtcB (3'-phosphate/5'-hydroxy nucleic acid ligase)
MSRTQAKRAIRGEQLQQQMQQHGIIVKAVSMSGLAEETGVAYKKISDVVASVIGRELQKQWRNYGPSAI